MKFNKITRLNKTLSQNAIFRDIQGQIMTKGKSLVSVVSICQLSPDSMYIGTDAGILFFQKSKKQFEHCRRNYQIFIIT